MKSKEKDIARNLRLQGHSLSEIVKKTGFTKSSVSLWVRDIELTKKQKEDLFSKSSKKEIIEKRRSSRLQNEEKKRKEIYCTAKKQINKISDKELWLIGIMLYWAEGGKKQRGLVRFSNGDPQMIKIMMEFFKKICCVPKDKFRGYIHIHPHLNHIKAEKNWSKISGISTAKFFKTYRKPNKSSQNKKDSLPFGTFEIYVCDTKLFLKIMGWIEGVAENILQASSK